MCLYAVVGLAAAAVWEAKPFTEWSDKETQAVLTDSPWAGKGTLTNARAGGAVGPVPDWKITVTWRTALPIRQAIVRQQIGLGGKTTSENPKIRVAVEPSPPNPRGGQAEVPPEGHGREWRTGAVKIILNHDS